MCPTLVGVDVVGEGQDRFVVGLGPLHRQFQLGILRAVGEVDHVRMQWFTCRVEVPYVIDQATPVEERLGRLLVVALVDQSDLETTVEEGELAQSRNHRARTAPRGSR